MRYSLAQLEAFFWVARLGGFGPAARHLNVTQPAISLRVREMEQSLGVKLFDRSRYRPVLSPQGAAIFSRAESLLSVADEIETELRHRDPLHGLLSIGATDVFAMMHLSELLAELESKHPTLRVQVTVDFSARLEHKLESRELDIAVMTKPRASHFAVEHLANVELAWFVPIGSRFDSVSLTPADLVDGHIISNPPPSHLHGTILDWFRRDGRSPTRISTCNPLSVMATLVSSGFGVALLPTALIRLSSCSRAVRVSAAHPAILPHELCVVAHDRTPRLKEVADGARRAIERGGFLVPDPIGPKRPRAFCENIPNEVDQDF
jgi:DNA-binding transcriptional LysR family regulator